MGSDGGAKKWKKTEKQNITQKFECSFKVLLFRKAVKVHTAHVVSQEMGSLKSQNFRETVSWKATVMFSVEIEFDVVCKDCSVSRICRLLCSKLQK